MTTDALTAALAQVKGWTPKDETWEFSDFRPENGRMPIAMAKTVATILNAVASDDLVPRAEIERGLSDPTAVHYSMVKGTIAKPSIAQICHVYAGALVPAADVQGLVDAAKKLQADMLERLASQIGDDVSVVFNHESLFKQSRAAITALRAQVEALTAERDAIAAVTVAACAGVAARHRSTVEINEPLWHEGQDWAVYRIEQAIRALSPLDPVKAAAGLLLAHTEAGKDTEIGPWLRAVAGKW